MPVLEALGELARGPAADAVLAALAQRAPTWLVELPWLLDDGPTRRRCASAPRAPRARGCCARRWRRRRDRRAARRCVLVLEDLHWATPRRSTCSRALLRRRDPARLLVLGTFRPDRPRGEPPGGGAGPRAVRARAVRGAAAAAGSASDAVAAYLAARFPAAPLPDGLAARARAAHGRQPAVHAQPGRPLAADGTLVERGGAVRLTRPRATLEAGVPPTLRAHIRDQLDRARRRGRRGAAGGERRRPRLLGRHARGGARSRPRGGRGALRRARPAHAR